MTNKKLKLTTVKIYEDFKEPFERDNLSTKMNLQKLVNRSLHLYLTDPDFKHKLLLHNALVTSGSL